MTEAISGTAQLVRIIRAQLNQPAAGRTARGKPGPAPEPASDQQLAELIALRVRDIRADDPARGRKAFRVFLEAILLSQFGQPLANDPKFHQLVSDVQREMEASAAIAPLVGCAIDQLLARQPRDDQP